MVNFNFIVTFRRDSIYLFEIIIQFINGCSFRFLSFPQNLLFSRILCYFWFYIFKELLFYFVDTYFPEYNWEGTLYILDNLLFMSFKAVLFIFCLKNSELSSFHHLNSGCMFWLTVSFIFWNSLLKEIVIDTGQCASEYNMQNSSTFK